MNPPSLETPTDSPRRPRTGGGFTLIELITIITIIGIVAAVAFPSLASLASTRRGAAQKVVLRDLSYARERAVSTGLRHWVIFSTSTNSYSVLAEPAGNPGRLNALTITDPATGSNYVQYLNTNQFVGVTLVSAAFDSGSEVGFDWQGRPLNNTAANLAAQGVVTLSGSKTVAVEANTGLITAP